MQSNMENKQDQRNEIGNFTKKPLIKKKQKPVVRQTLTSYKRMLNANPLLQLEEAGINVGDLLKNKSAILHPNREYSSTISKNNIQSDTKVINGFKQPQVNKPSFTDATLNTKKITLISSNRPNISNKNTTNSCNKNRDSVTSKYLQRKIQQNKPIIEVKSKVQSFHKKSSTATTSSTSVNTEKHIYFKGRPTLRRSVSSDNIQKKKRTSFTPKFPYSKPNHTCSNENLCPSEDINVFSPILEETSTHKPFVFKTPSAHKRRSVYQFTPTSTTRKTTLFQSSTPNPVVKDMLQQRLNQWLKSRGKQISSFQHLRCFDIDHSKKSASPLILFEENKENVEVLNEKSPSYENLNIVLKDEKGFEVTVKAGFGNDISKVSKEALVELQNLAHEGYPTIQCLGWLELIRNKHRKIDEEPEYWECRAAIEQSAGNIGNAVEYYKTAIIQGAEVNTVDKSLDLLLKKFSLLNISPNKSEVANIDKEKERIVREARNVFKSTIIQFAIREKKLRKNNSQASTSTKLVATPVRRSTRLSRSGYTSTPGVKLCMSLKEVENNSNIDFEQNRALC